MALQLTRRAGLERTFLGSSPDELSPEHGLDGDARNSTGAQQQRLVTRKIDDSALDAVPAWATIEGSGARGRRESSSTCAAEVWAHPSAAICRRRNNRPSGAAK